MLPAASIVLEYCPKAGIPKTDPNTMVKTKIKKFMWSLRHKIDENLCDYGLVKKSRDHSDVGLMRIVSFLSLFLFSSAQAFDHLECDSNLRGWIVTKNDSTFSAVITPGAPRARLNSTFPRLFLKTGENENVAEVFPWNGLYVRTNKSLADKYEVSSKEDQFGFTVSVKTKADNSLRTLDCKQSF